MSARIASSVAAGITDTYQFYEWLVRAIIAVYMKLTEDFENNMA